MKIFAIILTAFALLSLAFAINTWKQLVVIFPPSFLIASTCILLIAAVFVFRMKNGGQ